MRRWLAETHGPTCELVRHFLLRFFDSDLVTSPGQTALAVIGSSSMFLTWFPFVTGPLKDKYARLSALPSPEPYRWALRGDELWLIVMMMSVIGLLTVIKWQSLFPTLADYRAIGWLPVRAWQIFGAKLAALLTVATGAILLLNLVPALGFPMLARSRIAPLALALATSCYFIFFALLALRGIFRRGAAMLQGMLAAGMLAALVLSFSIGPGLARFIIQSQLQKYLPIAWFLAICDPDPALHARAQRAFGSLALAMITVLAAYTVSYRQHRKLMMEGLAAPRKQRRWVGTIFDRLVPDPHEQAIMVFLAKGIAGNGPHRMILMGYGGFGLAIWFAAARLLSVRACFVYWHVIVSVFILIGLRHLFSIPVELKANWAFRIAEGAGREQWRRAMDRFALCFGALALLALPFPLEARLLGWRVAASESALFAVFGLACYEAVFASWEKLPFTCSYLPGKTPMWLQAVRLLGLLTALELGSALLAACDHPVLYAIVFTALAGIWVRSNIVRREAWRETRLRWEEAPEAAVHTLNLLH